jgi:hypothetical protein
MAAARLSFWQMQDVGFWKLCGSGTGEGFTPRPNTAVWAILATWPDEATARHHLTTAPVYRRWARHASESWTILLQPTSARGEWAGVQPFTPANDPSPDGPIVALTRATRTHGAISLGAGTRGAISLVRMAKAYAFLDQRHYITPADVKRAALPVLRHRITLAPEVSISGQSIDDVLQSVLNTVQAPRT